MKTWNADLTAADAVLIGACAGSCLVATKTTCDCVCGGTYHGALASAVIGEVLHTVHSVDASSVRTVRRDKVTDFETRAAEAVAAEFGLGLVVSR